MYGRHRNDSMWITIKKDILNNFFIICNACELFVGYIDRDIKTSRKPESLHQKSL